MYGAITYTKITKALCEWKGMDANQQDPDLDTLTFDFSSSKTELQKAIYTFSIALLNKWLLTILVSRCKVTSSGISET